MDNRPWESFTNQKQWEGYLKNLVRTDEKALFKAIILIYANQTNEEQYSGESVEDNGIGFTKHDAKEMTPIAKKLKRGEVLNQSEIAKSKNKMPKYWKQLMTISKRQMKEREEQMLNALNAMPELELPPEAVAQFAYHNEVLRKCSEEGVSCDYGICDECILTTGHQMKMNMRGAE